MNFSIFCHTLLSQRKKSKTLLVPDILFTLLQILYNPILIEIPNIFQAKIKFDQIRDSFRGAPFEGLVSSSFFAIDTSQDMPNHQKVFEESVSF